MTETITPSEYGGQMGGKRRGVPVKTLKKILKKAGLKTTGKKAALTRRAKQAKLVKKGGVDPTQAEKIKTAEEEAEEARKAAEEAAKLSGTSTPGGRRKSRSKKYFF